MQKNGKVDINKQLQRSCKSDRLDLLQPNCPLQTFNLGFKKVECFNSAIPEKSNRGERA